MRAEKQPGKQRYGSWHVETRSVRDTQYVNVYAVRTRGTFENYSQSKTIHYIANDRGDVGPFGVGSSEVPDDIHEECMILMTLLISSGRIQRCALFPDSRKQSFGVKLKFPPGLKLRDENT